MKCEICGDDELYATCGAITILDCWGDEMLRAIEICDDCEKKLCSLLNNQKKCSRFILILKYLMNEEECNDYS